MSFYICTHCLHIVRRDSKKKWVKSYCEVTGKTVHLKIIMKSKNKALKV